MEQLLQSTLDGISPQVASISQKLSNGVAQINQMSMEITMLPGQMVTVNGNKEQQLFREHWGRLCPAPVR